MESYNFRLILTDDPKNQVAFPNPNHTTLIDTDYWRDCSPR